MKVGDLIDQLSEMPRDIDVCICASDISSRMLVRRVSKCWDSRPATDPAAVQTVVIWNPDTNKPDDPERVAIICGVQ
jgi:hypothetical protein